MTLDRTTLCMFIAENAEGALCSKHRRLLHELKRLRLEHSLGAVAHFELGENV